MGVASWQKCPEGKTHQMVWINNLEFCSEGGKCMYICRYNRKPEASGSNAPRRRFFSKKSEQIRVKDH